MIYQSSQEIPNQIPIFPLAGGLLLPRGTLPLHIFEPRYIEMVQDALRGNKIIGMIQPKNPDFDQLYDVGCAGQITSFKEVGDNRQILSLTGICRFRLEREIKRQGANPNALSPNHRRLRALWKRSASAARRGGMD